MVQGTGLLSVGVQWDLRGNDGGGGKNQLLSHVFIVLAELQRSGLIRQFELL